MKNGLNEYLVSTLFVSYPRTAWWLSGVATINIIPDQLIIVMVHSHQANVTSKAIFILAFLNATK